MNRATVDVSMFGNRYRRDRITGNYGMQKFVRKEMNSEYHLTFRNPFDYTQSICSYIFASLVCSPLLLGCSVLSPANTHTFLALILSCAGHKCFTLFIRGDLASELRS
jgi:hypothetical protein